MGMVKSYDLVGRHFGWRRQPKAATELQVAQYLLDRALRSQGIVSLDSICFGTLAAKAAVSGLSRRPSDVSGCCRACRG